MRKSDLHVIVSFKVISPKYTHDLDIFYSLKIYHYPEYVFIEILKGLLTYFVLISNIIYLIIHNKH